MSAFVKYTLARLGLFVVAFAIIGGIASIWLTWTSITVLWIALLALVVSAIASLILLGRLRDQVAESLQHRAQKAQKRFEEARSAEDVD